MATRTIKTVYYDHAGVAIRTNSAMHVDNAALRAFMHMHHNDYGAWSAEIFDDSNGRLYFQLLRGTGELRITYKRPEVNPWIPKELISHATTKLEAHAVAP
jgi:hypothetical protein